MKLINTEHLNVTLKWDADDSQKVGRLAFRDRVAYLEYDRLFVESQIQISPIYHQTGPGLHTPYQIDVFNGLHGMFNESLPDGWGRLLVDRRARQLGIDPAALTPLDRLACVGATGIGALTYAPAPDYWQEKDPLFDLGKLAKDAARVLEGEVSEVIAELGYFGGSPGGARPKVLVSLDDQGNAVHGKSLSGDYHDYLIKFPGTGDPVDIANIEFAYALMARHAGIDVPVTRLIEGNSNDNCFAIRRFDRQGDTRCHVQSLSGLLYSDIRLPALDYSDLIQVTRAITRDQEQCNAMFVRTVFNVLSHNRDDHARQFSFIMERNGTWRIAPAYDLTWSEGPGGEHSCTVVGNGKDISREQLLSLSKVADIKEREASAMIDRVADSVGRWRSFTEEAGVTRSSARRIEKSLLGVTATL